MERVTSETLISDVLASHPHAAAVFARYGLGCPSCLGAGMESVSAVALMHDVSVDALLEELNEDHTEPVREEP